MRRASGRRLAVVVAVLSVFGVTGAVAGLEPSQGSVPSPMASPPGNGYWLVGADGSVYPFGVPAFGSLSTAPPARPITGGTATPDGQGYWLVGADGGIFAFGGGLFSFGDAPYAGSAAGLQDALVERALAFGKPIVLVHGDSHVYRLGNNWPGAPNLIELQTFALDSLDRWVEVTVDPAHPDVFRFEKVQG
jgi:hypothetical protein